MARRGTIRAVAAASLALPLALSGCGGSTQEAGDPDTLTVEDYNTSDPGNTFYQTMLEECGQEIGVTIDRTPVPGEGLIAKVLQQGSSGTLPDLLQLDNPDVAQIAATGALAPLGDFGITGEDVAEGVLDAGSLDGELYALQPTTNTTALFYNEELLAQAGITPPTTWDELRTAAGALTTDGRYGFAFAAPNNAEGAWSFLPWMWASGGDEGDFATQESADALQLWVDLVDSGSAPTSVVNWSQADVNDQFIAGNVAMMQNGPWQFPALDGAEGLDYGVVPLPAPQAGDVVQYPLGGAAWTVPQTGDQDKMTKAAQIVECVNSDENILDNATDSQTVPTKPALADQLAQDLPSIQAFADEVPDLRSRTGELGQDWPRAANQIAAGVQSALTGQAPPLEALQQAQDG